MDPYSAELTGQALDIELLSAIAAAPGGFTVARRWEHFVYCDDEMGAAVLEAGARAGWWAVRRVVPEYHGIVAERSDLRVCPESVPAARAFFERLAASVPGGDYDGWEAALD